MPVTSQTLEIARELRGEVNALVDANMHQLAVALADSWDEVAADLQAAVDDVLASAAGSRVSRTAVARSQRLAAALEIITSRLEQILAATETAVVGDLRAVVDTAVRSSRAMLDSQLPDSSARGTVLVTWGRVDPDALNWIIVRTTQQIHARHLPLSVTAEIAMKRELVRGLASGANPRDTARRTIERVRGEFYGGHSRAERIARTETLDAMRAAQLEHDKANAKLLAGWEWVASLSTRTCSGCWGMHGTLHPVDEPGPIDHQNGRCARVPVAKSWQDLGFDVPEPAPLRVDAGSAFERLTPAQQLAILGPDRHAAWTNGDYPMSSWASRRSTSGWRDSIIPSPAPRS